MRVLRSRTTLVLNLQADRPRVGMGPTRAWPIRGLALGFKARPRSDARFARRSCPPAHSLFRLAGELEVSMFPV